MTTVRSDESETQDSYNTSPREVMESVVSVSYQGRLAVITMYELSILVLVPTLIPVLDPVPAPVPMYSV